MYEFDMRLLDDVSKADMSEGNRSATGNAHRDVSCQRLGPDSVKPHNKVDGELIAADEKFHLKRNMKVFFVGRRRHLRLASAGEMRV